MRVNGGARWLAPSPSDGKVQSSGGGSVIISDARPTETVHPDLKEVLMKRNSLLRILVIVAPMMIIFCLLVSGTSAAAQSVNSQSDNGRWSQDEKLMIRIGLAVAPVPLNIARKDQDMVGMGSYLVNVTN